jgi:hypothetical protein
MTQAQQQQQPEGATAADDDKTMPPRSDLIDALGWVVLGAALLIGSWRMDRLQSQNINPYTVPGLLPGLLGLAMLGLGLVLGLRSWRRGALSQAAAQGTAHDRTERLRIWVVVGLCVGYSVVLVGHGLPFWLASSVYVTASILVLQRMSSEPQQRALTPGVWLKALVIGVMSAVITQLVFQEIFLVRLP